MKKNSSRCSLKVIVYLDILSESNMTDLQILCRSFDTHQSCPFRKCETLNRSEMNLTSNWFSFCLNTGTHCIVLRVKPPPIHMLEMLDGVEVKPDVWTVCSPTRFKLLLFEFTCRSVSVVVDAALKPKTNGDQLWNRTPNAAEVKSDGRKGRFVYPWWSVDVGGLCFRNIQISVFKILLVPHFRGRQANVGLDVNMSGNVQRGVALFQLQIQSLSFSNPIGCISQCTRTHKENVNLALITLQLR